ncbi:hypothetical protein RSAG8_10255, partial [Rhizoctonia solani AG-8 WAC10335]
MPGTNRPRSKKRLVDSNTNNNLQPRSDIESSVDQTVVGLYDYPPKDARSREYVSGRHPLRSTERKLQYRAFIVLGVRLESLPCSYRSYPLQPRGHLSEIK